MRILLFTAFVSFATSDIAISGDDKASTPNPAKKPFPSHWDAKSWDAPAKAAFWTVKAKEVAPKTSKKATLSPTPQPSNFLDRQSEK